jgi:hypothetical protein
MRADYSVGCSVALMRVDYSVGCSVVATTEGY